MNILEFKQRLAEFEEQISVEYDKDAEKECREFLEHLEQEGYALPPLYKAVLLELGGIEFDEPLWLEPASSQDHTPEELALLHKGSELLSRSFLVEQGNHVAELGVLNSLPIHGGDWWFDEIPKHYIHIGWFDGQAEPDSDIALFINAQPDDPRFGYICALDMCEDWDSFEDVLVDTSFASFCKRLMLPQDDDE
ncbi:MAG: hypothetical protein VYB06_01970 [Cyanobacteriota bacterium]|nr:hypothetical protein [Cyanobacteriota bacterium]